MGKLMVIVARFLTLCAVLLVISAVAAAQPTGITQVETFREGFFRLFFTDPHNEVKRFGFVGINGSGWAEATFPLSSPSFGRVSPGIIEYPFNHLCDTGSAYESDIRAWISDNADQPIDSIEIHL
jgi:hypothetical protein